MEFLNRIYGVGVYGGFQSFLRSAFVGNQRFKHSSNHVELSKQELSYSTHAKVVIAASRQFTALQRIGYSHR